MEAEIIPANRLESLLKETDELIAIFTSIAKRVKDKDEG
jgi:hypothetical protein